MHDHSYPDSTEFSRMLLLIAVLITTSFTTVFAQSPGWPIASEEAQKDTLVLTSHPVSSPGLHTQLHIRPLGGAATDTIWPVSGHTSPFSVPARKPAIFQAGWIYRFLFHRPKF